MRTCTYTVPKSVPYLQELYYILHLLASSLNTRQNKCFCLFCYIILCFVLILGLTPKLKWQPKCHIPRRTRMLLLCHCYLSLLYHIFLPLTTHLPALPDSIYYCDLPVSFSELSGFRAGTLLPEMISDGAHSIHTLENL